MNLNRQKNQGEPDVEHYSPPGIGAIMKQHYPSAKMQEPVDNKPRCRFDMFVRWNKKERREKYAFTYRGDHFGETEPAKMLWSLVRMFMNKHAQMFVVELYDNTKPKSDPDRYILKYSGGVLIENRLQQYEAMLENFPVADYLKSKK